MATIFDAVNRLDRVVDSLNRGHWAPVFWTPFSGAEERLMVALAVELGNTKRVLRIVDHLVFKAFYQAEGTRALNIVDFIVNVLNAELLSGRSINELNSYTDNFAIGETRDVVARDIKDAVIQIIQIHSSIMTKQRYLAMIGKEKIEMNEDWPKTVRNFCHNLMPDIGSFDRSIVIGDRPISTFFTTKNSKFVALSLQLNSDKQWSSLCMKARDAHLLKNNRMVKVDKAVLLIKREDKAEELIDRYQFEQRQIGQSTLDYRYFNNPLEVPYYLREQSRALSN